MILNNKIYTLIAVIGFSISLANSIFAQQTPLFSEYNYNPFIINPAYAGLTPNSEFSISNSGYFSPFEGSPKSFAFS